METMSEPDDDEISDKINAAANLAKAIPLYNDALQPVAKETGKALGTVGRLVNVALSPIRGIVWGGEQVEIWLQNRVASKLSEKTEDIITPDLAIAGPVIESLRFSGHKPELSEMFAGLLASAMNSQTCEECHPAFVAMIQSMQPLDAKILAEISDSMALPTVNFRRIDRDTKGGVNVISDFNERFFSLSVGDTIWEDDKRVGRALDNLERLSLIRRHGNSKLTHKSKIEEYEKLEAHPLRDKLVEYFEVDGFEIEVSRCYVALTKLGRSFCASVFV